MNDIDASSIELRTLGGLSPNPVRLRREHPTESLALSRPLEWPYRHQYWQFAFDLGRGFAVEIKGRLAGTALWWPYDEDFASAGMVIVSSEHQAILALERLLTR